jgi:GlpG protein
MRLIGHLETEDAARKFGDYLVTEKIANRLELQQGEGWAVWVEDEDQLADAANRLAAFRANPSAPEFEGRSGAAAALRAEQEKQDARYRKRVLSRRHLFRPLTPYGFGPLTFVLIAASTAVFIWSRFGTDHQPIMRLFITNFWEDGNTLKWHPGLPEIRDGQVWRLITPIFIHINLLHILFNMLWLRDLGSMIEARQSSLHLAAMVLVFAACSNLGQYYAGIHYLDQGPNFGGMSGVVYGLLGYIWLRGRFDPGSGLFLHPSTVTMMIVWFVVCWTKVLGPIANAAHAVGLFMGMAWGYISSLRYR